MTVQGDGAGSIKRAGPFRFYGSGQLSCTFSGASFKTCFTLEVFSRIRRIEYVEGNFAALARRCARAALRRIWHNTGREAAPILLLHGGLVDTAASGDSLFKKVIHSHYVLNLVRF
jgi:hypothetical protein